MRQRTLQEMLETSSEIDLLEDEHGKLWMMRDLLEAFAAGKSTLSEDAPPGLTYDSLLFIDGENIHLVSAQGSIGQTPVFRKITPPKKPYRVLSIDHGYRVVFMEHEGQWKYRLIEGRLYYRHKQAAYRRKDALNACWCQHNLP